MLGPALALALIAGAGPATVGAPPEAAKSPPFKTPSEEPLDFRGPGRDAAEPDVDEVVLGWFGPADPDHPEHGELWRGASLALEQENAAGGYRGKPFRLEPAWSDSPWKAGILGVTHLVYDRGAWAVIGGVDGASTHLAVQLALKSYFLLLSPGSTDATADHANVPWLFSLPPSDEAIAPVLAAAIATEAAGGRRFAIVAGTDHDSHAALLALRRELGALRLSPPSWLVELPPGTDVGSALADVLGAKPPLLVVLADARATSDVIAAARAAGLTGPIVGGASAAGRSGKRGGDTSRGRVLAPAWIDRSLPGFRGFAAIYEARWHAAPGWAAASGYDAVRLVAAAIRRAGLNRARIRDAVRALAPYEGATGVVRWSPLGRNQPAVRIEPR